MKRFMDCALLTAAGLLFNVCISEAQNVTVIGPVTVGNLPQFNSTTIIKDSGIPASSLTPCTNLGAFKIGLGGGLTQCSDLAASTALLNGGQMTILHNGIGTTVTDGLVISNSTPAAAGTQQISPSIRLTGQGWKTNATAGSQQVDFDIYTLPIQGTVNPTGFLCFAPQINGAGFNCVGGMTSGGVFSAFTGYQINSLAPSRHYLIGDGTNYIDGTIQAGDLPGGFSGFANPSASIGLSAVNGAATTALRSDSAPPLSQSIVPTWTGSHIFAPSSASNPAITITPPAGSYGQGISETSSGPTTSTAGPFAYNILNITHTSQITGSGALDSYGLQNTYVAGWRVNCSYGGANLSANAIACGVFASRLTASTVNRNGDLSGIVASSYSNVNGPGGFGLYGVIGYAACDTSCVDTDLSPLDLSYANTGSVVRGFGARITIASNALSGSPAQPSSFSTAVLFANASTQAAGWQHLFRLQNSEGLTTSPLTTAGIWFSSEGSYSIGSFADLSNITFATWIFNFQNYTVAASGLTTISGNAIATTNTPRITLQNTTAAAAGAQQQSPSLRLTGQGWKTNATAASQQIDWDLYALPVQGAANPSSFLCFSPQINGGGFTCTGGISSGGVFSASVGYQVNSLAPSGQFIRGNGTNGVFSAIQAGDLPAPFGGTTFAVGAILVGNTTSNLNSVADVATGALLASGGVNTNPAYCTACTLTTSLTVPTLAGGSAAGSSLTLESTSGAGTTDSIVFQTASQSVRMKITTGGLVQVGPNVTPTAQFTVNSNAAAPPGGTALTPTMQTLAVDAGSNLSVFDAYGTGKLSYLTVRAARGTAASFTATQSGDFIGFFGMIGATGANTFGNETGTGAGGVFFGGQAGENWSSTNQGAQLQMYATPNGGKVLTEYIALGGSLAISMFNMGAGAGNGSLCGATNIVNSTGGAVTFDSGANCIVSLREAKTDIRPLEDALSEVMNLKPVEFRYRDGYGDNGRRQQVGLIAEDVEKVDTRCAAYGIDDKLEGVRYIQCVAIAFRAIQQLKSDNDNLRAEVAQLRKSIGR